MTHYFSHFPMCYLLSTYLFFCEISAQVCCPESALQTLDTRPLSDSCLRNFVSFLILLPHLPSARIIVASQCLVLEVFSFVINLRQNATNRYVSLSVELGIELQIFCPLSKCLQGSYHWACSRPSHFSFYRSSFSATSQESLLRPKSQLFHHMFSFIILAFAFWSVIHLPVVLHCNFSLHFH